jgi:hypothetical protein
MNILRKAEDMGNCESIMSIMRKNEESFSGNEWILNQNAEECKEVEVVDDKSFLISNEDRALNLLFRDEESFKTQKSIIWPGLEDFEVLIDRVINRKKPMATISLKKGSKLTTKTWRRLLKPYVHIRVIGPYPNKDNGCPMLSIVHADMPLNSIKLGDLLTEEEKIPFLGAEMTEPLFKTKVKEYINGPDIRQGNSYLECALVYGYPLNRALETSLTGM